MGRMLEELGPGNSEARAQLQTGMLKGLQVCAILFVCKPTQHALVHCVLCM